MMISLRLKLHLAFKHISQRIWIGFNFTWKSESPVSTMSFWLRPRRSAALIVSSSRFLWSQTRQQQREKKKKPSVKLRYCIWLLFKWSHLHCIHLLSILLCAEHYCILHCLQTVTPAESVTKNKHVNPETNSSPSHLFHRPPRRDVWCSWGKNSFYPPPPLSLISLVLLIVPVVSLSDRLVHPNIGHEQCTSIKWLLYNTRDVLPRKMLVLTRN